ncbi:hypothetical protein [Terribacillus saccharophilus]|uniref:hypothetical protein n=1 Tax=Terribacillus saccharophilus TaxID=361277 RepID=UPI003D2D0CE5
MEEVKRLSISTHVLRKLFMYSGNQCAFPGCANKIINDDGNYIGQLCHIEAANKGGERFNQAMTNKERSSYDNLLLLCYEHHITTDDVKKYPVTKMKEIKETHERKYKQLLDSFIRDVTKENQIIYPKTLHRINHHLSWNNSDEELQGTLDLIYPELKKLGTLTHNTRTVFYLMLDTAEDDLVLVDEVSERLSASRDEFNSQINILVKNRLVSEPDVDYFTQKLESKICTVEGWPAWLQIKEYCSKVNIQLEDMILDLRFDLLD